MEKMKVLVTGANGYIGRCVTKSLLDMGHEVLAADVNFSEVDERAKRIEVPIFGEDKDIFDKLERPDICIHLAWRDGFIHDSQAHIIDLPKHFLFIKNMLEGGLKQITVMGSMHEIGYWEGAIDENTPANPISLYGIAKNALRQMTIQLATANNAIYQWLRAYYIMGDDLKNKSVFTRIVSLEKEGVETFPFTSGKNLYDFIKLEELANQIACASVQSEVHGIINCCTGNPKSLAEKVEEFIKINNFKIRPNYGAFPDRPYDSPGVWGNPDKINTILKNVGK